MKAKKNKCPSFHKRITPLLAEAQNWRCAHCGMVMETPPPSNGLSASRSPGAVTIDHILPSALGGPDEWENMVASCGFCNHARGAQLGALLNRLYPPPRPKFATEIERETARMSYEQRQMKRAIRGLRPGA